MNILQIDTLTLTSWLPNNSSTNMARAQHSEVASVLTTFDLGFRKENQNPAS